MSKIIVITTGGTIASVLQDGAFSVEQDGHAVGCEINAAAAKLGFEVELHNPLNKNSESFAPMDWLDILAAIDEASDVATNASGVVVLHGTDTMEFSLAAACAFQQRWTKRVCFTGAMVSPERANSDARINLLAALSFAADTAYDDGVYLAFRADASNKSANILHGSEVKPLLFDEGCFRSLYGNVVASYSEQGGVQGDDECIKPSCPVVNSPVLPSMAELIACQQQVVVIKLYPGIDLYTLKALTAGRSVVVIELYHSGTAPASAAYDDVIRLIEKLSDSTFFVLSAFPKRTLQQPYASTQALIQAGGHVYADIQSHTLYVFCLLMSALGKSRGEIEEQLHSMRMG